MITGYDERNMEFQGLNFNRNFQYPREPKDQLMYLEEDDCEEEEIDIYQQLAEKDHYLILAAEAGKVLLEKNQELTKHFESLQEEYMQKIECLEQDRHHLKRELNQRGSNYESRMQDLQQEISNLGGQLQTVQKSSRVFEDSQKSTYDDLAGQNKSLLSELEKVKSYNHELTQQVVLLIDRIDKSSSGKASDVNGQLTKPGVVKQSDYAEVKNLEEEVRQLAERKDLLEQSLHEIVIEKHSISGLQMDTRGKFSNLECNVSNLRQQMIMCREELQTTKRNNEHLKDQLEEYMLMQSPQSGGRLSTSLFSELESSIPEVDMNFCCMSTPMKYDEEDVSNIRLSSMHHEKLRNDMQNIYYKLKALKNELCNKVGDVEMELPLVNGEIVTKLVDQIIDIIHNRTLASGFLNNGQSSLCQIEIDRCDNYSQPDSQLSDQDSDILEQQVHDLNQRLNITICEMDKLKRGLVTAETSAKNSEDKAQALTVKTNCQEREVENLRRERQILLSEKTMEEKLRKALEDRDEALKRENEIKGKYEEAKNDMGKLHDQLIAAVQQKLELSEQLEQWQFDMASLIDQQLSSKIKRENQKSRKRCSSNTSKTTRSLAAKLFAYKSTKETPQSSTG